MTSLSGAHFFARPVNEFQRRIRDHFQHFTCVQIFLDDIRLCLFPEFLYLKIQ